MIEKKSSIFKILIIDDNKSNLDLLKKLIVKKIRNVEVFQVLSAEDALETALFESVSLILLSVNMSNMDGYEIAKLLKLKKETKNIPIIFLTNGLSGDDFFKKDYTLKAVDYLAKPFDENLFINKIRLYKSLFLKQKEIEEHIKKQIEQNKIFHAIFDFSGMGIFVTDANGKILKHNPSFEKMLECEKEYIDGRNILEITHVDDAKISSENFQKLKNNTINSYVLEKRYIKNGDKTIWVKVIVSAVRDEKKNLINSIGMVDDLTIQKKMQEDKIKKEQLLIQQSKMAAMGEMIGAIAHQWRQPLNALGISIQDILDAYEHGELDKKYLEESVEFSNKQIQYMSKTIDDFRDFFKPNKERAIFDIFMAAVEVTDLVKAQFKNHNIHITFSGGLIDKKRCEVYGYVNEFKQVMLNILNNSKDAIIDVQKKDKYYKGIVNINVDKIERKVIVEITDNGGGVPVHIFDRIFEPYFSTKGSKGTGIGLYMSKAIVEDSMGGILSVKNLDDGTGAVFAIELKSE